jgi:hypothetical protein
VERKVPCVSRHPTINMIILFFLARSYISDGLVPPSHLLHTIHYVPMPQLRYASVRAQLCLFRLPHRDQRVSPAALVQSHFDLHIWRLNLGLLLKPCALVRVIEERRLH